MAKIVSNQIDVIQTAKKLIATHDKLNAAPVNRYAQIHAGSRDDTDNDRRTYSLIEIEIQDYSAGSGQNNRIARYNLSPREIQFLLTRVELGYTNYEYYGSKIFGNPNPQTGLCTAKKITITRTPVDKNGVARNRPWYFEISDGEGRKLKNKSGGFYMEGNSFRAKTVVNINLTDEELYGLLKSTDAYIRCWEMATAMQLIPEGKQAYADYLASLRQQGQNQYQYQYQQQYQQEQYQQSYGDYQNCYQQAPAGGQGDYQQAPAYPDGYGQGYGQETYGEPYYPNGYGM